MSFPPKNGFMLHRRGRETDHLGQQVGSQAESTYQLPTKLTHLLTHLLILDVTPPIVTATGCSRRKDGLAGCFFSNKCHDQSHTRGEGSVGFVVLFVVVTLS